MTESECALWQKIRRKQLGVQFYRQKPLGNYIVDFYSHVAKLVIEVDGGQHYHGEAQVKDEIRDKYLRNLGLKVLRFSSREVLKNIEGAVEKITAEIPPNLPLRKGGIQYRIQQLLIGNNCEYEMFEHEPVRTSEEAAALRPGISMHQGAKALVCETKLRDGERNPVMVVLPADQKADLKKVRRFMDAKDVYLISPEDVLKLTGVEVGGVPPLGNLFDFPTFMDSGVLENEKIAFNAGDRSISIIMKSKDLERIVKPKVGDFTK